MFTLKAPAKLNLFRHITGRRDDGYHNLQTLFQLLDYGDDLEFRSANAGNLGLHIEGASQPPPMAGNLITRAAQLLRSHTGATDGADITLHKRLPMGAGLGGGSANAAMTLLGLNALWRTGLPEDELAELGLALGADVPLFVRGHSAWAEGVGDKLQPVAIAPAWYLVITPDCVVSTAEIFSHQQLTRHSPAIKMADFLAGRGQNDCEKVTRLLYPQVENALQWLDQRAPARMTGTGGSVFAVFPDRFEAERILATLPNEWRGFVARGIDKLEHDFQQA